MFARKLCVATVAVSITGIAAIAAAQHAGKADHWPRIPRAAKTQPRPLKPVVKAATKVVGGALTNVRRVPHVVSQPPKTPAGHIRPCSKSSFVPDFEQTIAANVVDQLFGAVIGATQETPAEDVLEITLPTLLRLFGVATETAGDSTESIEEIVRRLLHGQLIESTFDEVEQCPELVERVVTTAITGLRPKQPKDSARS
jgi:hypothetical protein